VLDTLAEGRPSSPAVSQAFWWKSETGEKCWNFSLFDLSIEHRALKQLVRRVMTETRSYHLHSVALRHSGDYYCEKNSEMINEFGAKVKKMSTSKGEKPPGLGTFVFN
jgi:hypothetical protein